MANNVTMPKGVSRCRAKGRVLSVCTLPDLLSQTDAQTSMSRDEDVLEYSMKRLNDLHTVSPSAYVSMATVPNLPVFPSALYE